ncbi:MAG: hypothetical protein V4444_10745 [Pseudomonadota bacterium]
MTAKFRLAMAVLGTGLALGPVAALAQDVPPAQSPSTTQTNTADPVGPRELENFNLPGTVTRPADPQPSPTTNTTAPSSRRPGTEPTGTTPRPPSATPSGPARDSTSGARAAAASADAQTIDRPARDQRPPATANSPTSTVTMQLPPVGDSPTDSASGDDLSGSPQAVPGVALPANDIPLGWMAVAVMLLAGAGFYYWRNRQRQAMAGGPDYDMFEAPVPTADTRRAPAPAPAPAPASRAVSPPRPAEMDADSMGLVSTRLRPWIDITFRPTACTIDDDNVTFEFELDLFNSGSTPARAILVEASYFNASETQEPEIEHFFANPVGAGGRATSLAPLKRMTIKTKVVTPRAQVREYEAGGRKVFVPLIAFNALYRWSSGEGQTSVSYVVGRTTDGERLAPFRLDQAGREFRTLGERPLPVAIRH